MNNIKDDIEKILSRLTISIPEFREGHHLINPRSTIVFDSLVRIDKENSIIDFVIRKDNGQIFVMLSDDWFRPTDEQRKQIENNKTSIILIKTDVAERNVTDAIYDCEVVRKIEMEPFGVVKEYLQAVYWVYHNKFGWGNGSV